MANNHLPILFGSVTFVLKINSTTKRKSYQAIENSNESGCGIFLCPRGTTHWQAVECKILQTRLKPIVGALVPETSSSAEGSFVRQEK